MKTFPCVDLLAGAMLLLLSVSSLGAEEPVADQSALRTALLASIAAIGSHRAVIDYDLTRSTSPLKGGDAAIERKIREFANQRHEMTANIAPNPIDTENEAKMVESCRKVLKAGYHLSGKCRLILGDGFNALKSTYAEGTGVPTLWAIRRGAEYIEYREAERSASIRDKSRSHARDELELALDSVGRFGAPTPDFAKVIKEGVIDHGEGNTFRISLDGSAIEAKATAFGFEVISFGEKSLSYERRTTFGEYKSYGGMRMPSSVLVMTQNGEYDMRDEYVVTDLGEPGAETRMQVPFVNTSLPKVHIIDSRFTPQISYFAVSQRPSDEQVVEWLTDPAALKKYNDLMRRLPQ